MNTPAEDARDRALAHLEAWLERAHPGFADDKKLHAEARALSEAYTTTSATGAVSVDAAASIAYLAHFGPRAIAAVCHALGAVTVPETCVDVGAGSGASALALFMAGAKSVTLVERSARALETAKHLLDGLGEVTLKKGALGGVVDRRAELVLSAFSFGELAAGLEAERADAASSRAVRDVDAAPHERGGAKVGGDGKQAREGRDADDALAEHSARAAFGALERAAPKASAHVIVDAGDRARSRRIQHLRDVLVAEGRAIAAPCPHSDGCPALVRERDWCHTRIDKGLPPKLAAFARAVGRDDERMALSFLVVAKNAARPSAGILAVGDALEEKGRARLPVCGPGGLRFVQVLKRHKDAYTELVKIERGARLPPALLVEADGASVPIKDAAISVERAESLRFRP